jgi:hypothetical protein
MVTLLVIADCMTIDAGELYSIIIQLLILNHLVELFVGFTIFLAFAIQIAQARSEVILMTKLSSLYLIFS